MDNQLVSIITPMYNGEKYVSQTIESVLAQTYQNWEMIIVDDGSKDASSQIVKNIQLRIIELNWCISKMQVLLQQEIMR